MDLLKRLKPLSISKQNQIRSFLVEYILLRKIHKLTIRWLWKKGDKGIQFQKLCSQFERWFRKNYLLLLLSNENKNEKSAFPGSRFSRMLSVPEGHVISLYNILKQKPRHYPQSAFLRHYEFLVDLPNRSLIGHTTLRFCF